MANKVPGLAKLVGVLPSFGDNAIPAYDGTTRSFWQSNFDATEECRAPLSTNVDCDMLVVGAGFTGLSCARELAAAHPNARICVVEKEFVGFGASGRNAGFCTNQVADNRLDESPYPDYFHELGAKAVDYLLNIINTNNIECEMMANGFSYAAVNKSHLKKVSKLEARMQGKRLKTVSVSDDKDAIDKFGSPLVLKGVRDEQGFNMNPFRLARALLELLPKQTVSVYENTSLDALEFEEGTVRATFHEYEICAKHCFVCTNAYSALLGIDQLNKIGFPLHVYNVVSQRLSSEEWSKLGDWGKNSHGWYTLHNVLWAVRATSDRRLLVSTGHVQYIKEDGLHIANQFTQNAYEHVTEALNTFFPQFKGNLFVDKKWEGVIYVSANSLPSMGSLTKHPNVYYSMAYCGHGVSLSNYSGVIMNKYFITSRLDPALSQRLLVPRGSFRDRVVPVILAILHNIDLTQDERTIYHPKSESRFITRLLAFGLSTVF